MDADYSGIQNSAKQLLKSFEELKKNISELEKTSKKINKLYNEYIEMTEKNVEVVILPDIHGRTFWKETVKDYIKKKYVFLGDYFDPYPRERYSFNDVMNNFEDIIKFKKENPDNVILLLGNHDFGYLERGICSCRQYRGPEFEDVRNVLMTNIDLFDICYEEIINDKHFVFSHAGIRREWDERVRKLTNYTSYGEDNKPLPCMYYNNLFHKNVNDNNSVLYELLADVSYIRGGHSRYGSIVWADIREFADKYLDGKKMENKSGFDDIIQIVGHTQLYDKAVSLNDKVFDLDIREPFYIDGLGNVKYWRTNKIVEPITNKND